MTADIAGMDLKELDVLDYDNYESGGKSFIALPPEGRYWGQAPEITDESFGVTKEGRLKVSVDPIVIVNSGTGDGYAIRFTSLSSKKYANRNASQMLDFVRACGLDIRPNTNDELKAALKMCSGRTFQFALVWEAYNKDTQVETSGQENFPTNPDGTRQTYLDETTSDGKKVYANGKVKYFIDAVAKK